MNKFPLARIAYISGLLLLAISGLGTAVSAQIVPVGNVEELYSAVNNAAYTGATISIAPGVYSLTVNAPDSTPRPNRGRLDLQADMSLIGVTDDLSAVVIDASALPASSYLVSGPVAAVRTGKGRNSIEWLTVRNAINGQANIDTGLQSPGPTYVMIAHVASTGSTRGLNVINFGPAASGEIIEADIDDHDFFDNRQGLSEGVRLGNFQGAVGSTVNARMTGNRSWGQQQGRLIVNNRATNSTVNVVSSGNRFYENGAGTIIAGGLSSNNTTANGNTINFEAHGDRFLDNKAFTTLDIGGLIILGGENISIPNGVNHNTVIVSLWGCRMGDNNTYDLLAIGARSAPESIGSPGVDNRVTIEIHGEGNGKGRWQPVEFFTDVIPIATVTTNVMTVYR